MRTWLLAFLLCPSLVAATATVGTLTANSITVTGIAEPVIDYGTPDVFGEGTANEFTLEFVEIEPAPTPKATIYSDYRGASGAPFRMMKYHVTEADVRKANALWNLQITGDIFQGDKKPAGQIDQIEAFKFVNALNEAKGYQRAYNIDAFGNWDVWPNTDDWDGGTNGYRHKDAFYFLPSTHQIFDAAMWDPASASWKNYGQGTTDPPTPVDGFFRNGSTNAGYAVYAQRFCPAFPEWDSTNVISVTVTTNGAGGLSTVTFDAYVSGHVFQITNSATVAGTAYTVTQGAVTSGKVTVDTWQKITHVPGTLTNFVAGTGYSDGAGTITLGGLDVQVQVITDGEGGVAGAIPLGGRFATEDYTTALEIVQAGGSGASCKVNRYTSTYYDGPQVPDTMTVHTAGSGYSDGAATITLHRAEWDPTIDLDPVTGLSYYKITYGQADVDRAGGPSPQGVYGLFGNSSNMSDTSYDWDNDDASDRIYYHGGWHFRGRTSPTLWADLGGEAWYPQTPTTGAPTNGFRVASKVPEEE